MNVAFPARNNYRRRQNGRLSLSDEPTFTIVDSSGNTLHFDRFAYERSVEAARGDYHDANWLRCRITLRTPTLKQSVDAELLTAEINELSDVLRAALSGSDAAKTFKPLEPYIELRVTRRDNCVDVMARLDLAPALGPVIEFRFECRPAEIEATPGAIARVQEAFPVR
jgi:hypothetical protein